MADNSVDIIMTDPVYEDMAQYEWLSRTAMRVLKPNSPCLVFYATMHLPATIAAMQGAGLVYRWQMFGYITNEVKHRPAPTGKCVHVGLLWFDKGKSKRHGFMLDVRAVPTWTKNDASNHPWSKHPLVVSYYLEGLSKRNDVVFDPFCGGGAIPATAKMLGRQYIGFEIDEQRATTAQQNVDSTRVAPVQTKMKIDATQSEMIV